MLTALRDEMRSTVKSSASQAQSVVADGAAKPIDAAETMDGKIHSYGETPTMESGVRHVVVCGAAGCGKGKQVRRLVQALHLPHITLGGLIQQAVQQHSVCGQNIAQYTQRREAIPEELIQDVVVEQLSVEGMQKNGWLLDGFPHTAAQAGRLFRSLVRVTDVVIVEEEEAVLLEHAARRHFDPTTNRVCTLENADGVPMDHWVKRKDDSEDAVRHRYATHVETQEKLCELYGDACVRVVVGGRGEEEVFTEVSARLTDRGLDCSTSAEVYEASYALFAGTSQVNYERSMPLCHCTNAACQLYMIAAHHLRHI